MKDYMVAHTFKSEEMREQYFELTKDMTSDDIRKNMKNENANFQMNWDHYHSREYDQHFFELKETPLGIYNERQIEFCLGPELP